MRRRRWILALLGALTLPAPARGADPVLRAEVDRARVAEGEVIALTVTMEGFSRRAGDPRIEAPEGFEIYDAGRSTNISWINGNLSSSTVHTYQLLSRRAGTYTLPPVTVEDRGREYRSDPIALEVVPAGAATRTPAEGDAPADTGGRGLFARVEIDKTEAYADEQITMRFRLYQRKDVRLYEISGFEPPGTEGFWREDLGPQQDYTVRLDGDLYQVREISWVLFPTRAGDLEIGPGRIVCHVPARSRRRRGFFSSGLFNQEQLPLTTEPIRVHVRPLPEEGQPEGFTGSVGQYTIEARFESDEAHQGEPFALNVTIRGSGHLQTVGAPAWPEWEGFRVYDSGDAVSVQKREGRVTGEKTFTQVLIPTRTGVIDLEPIHFSFFDPDRETYRTVSTAPMRIDVLAAATVPGATGRGEVVALGEDILYIRQEISSGLLAARASGVGVGWLVHLVPLALLTGAYWLRRRRAALENDPVLARRSRAFRRAEARLASIDPSAPAAAAAALAEVWETYLSDWLDVEVRGLKRSSLKGELEAAHLAPESIERVLSQLAWADDIRFGAGATESVAGRLSGASGLLHEVEHGLRRSPLGARTI